MPCPICPNCDGPYPGPPRSGVLLKEAVVVPFNSDKRVYLNADRSKVVDEDSPDAAYLLVNEGGEVSDEDAKQYGLKKPSAKAEASTKEEEAAVAAESKQEPKPENKAVRMSRDKDD